VYHAHSGKAWLRRLDEARRDGGNLYVFCVLGYPPHSEANGFLSEVESIRERVYEEPVTLDYCVPCYRFTGGPAAAAGGGGGRNGAGADHCAYNLFHLHVKGTCYEVEFRQCVAITVAGTLLDKHFVHGLGRPREFWQGLPHQEAPRHLYLMDGMVADAQYNVVTRKRAPPGGATHN
jgi:hypothetical protein